MQKALSVNEINQLASSNDGLIQQNRGLYSDSLVRLKALQLSIIDVSVALSGKEPSDAELQKEVDDYIKQAREALEKESNAKS